MVNQGLLEDALLRLEQATREEPRNREYRIHYLNTRAQVIGSLLVEAQRELSSENFDKSEALYQRVLILERDNGQAVAGMAEIKQARRHALLISEAASLVEAKKLDLAEQKVVETRLFEVRDEIQRRLTSTRQSSCRLAS
jgi:type II secretory pathway component HofQ